MFLTWTCATPRRMLKAAQQDLVRGWEGDRDGWRGVGVPAVRVHRSGDGAAVRETLPAAGSRQPAWELVPLENSIVWLIGAVACG
jgi:hypothetical protein